jgi:hypothetical protein
MLLIDFRDQIDRKGQRIQENGWSAKQLRQPREDKDGEISMSGQQFFYLTF